MPTYAAYRSITAHHWTSWLPLLCAFGLLVQTGLVQANAALNGPTVEAVKRRGQIVIGYREEAAPFSMRVNGQPTGYAMELCAKVADRLAAQLALSNTAIRPVVVPVDQVERYMRGGTVDLLCSATSDTPARREVMDFSPPIYIASLKVAVRSKDGIRSGAQLAGKPVAVIGNGTAERTLTRLIETNKAAFTLSKAVGADAALGQLQLGWAAGYARDDVLLAAQIATTTNPSEYTVLPESYGTEVIALAYRRGDTGFGAWLAAAMGSMRKSGELTATYERWFLKPIAPHNRALGMTQSEELKAAWAKLP